MSDPDELARTAERSYLEGQRAAWTAVLRAAIAGLGVSDPAAGQARWLVERQEAVAMLRRVCALLGDDDWPDDLHLADVIEKHLWRHLEE